MFGFFLLFCSTSLMVKMHAGLFFFTSSPEAPVSDLNCEAPA